MRKRALVRAPRGRKMKKLLSAVSINVKNFSGGRFFALYLAFLLAVLLRDTFCFLSFVSRVESLRLAGAVAGCCFFACGAYFSLRHVEKSPERGTWLTPAIVLFFTLLALVRMALPDNNFDTFNYHIYLQENISLLLIQCISKLTKVVEAALLSVI